ncbi:MAG: LL-diaminopimelate aminotransferase [Anaerotruncus rubiinfantis]|jgi:LL-diaminopimelate aminotransferase
MAHVNENYRNLKDSYLFSDINKRVAAFAAAHPEKKIIRLGIGDVTLPLMPRVIEALRGAVDEMGSAATFHGYGPEQGYGFLRDAIRDYYAHVGTALEPDEIFVSDGAKSDLGNLTDLFAADNIVLIPDPVYPVYVDTNLMNGRKIIYLAANAENGFLPMPDVSVHVDLIYLCSPNNPTGAVYTKEQLKGWVDYALANEAVILFDAAYEAFISDPALPRSIYEIEGAKSCAIELCSLSKTAGFTGTRCGYTVVPHALTAKTADGGVLSLNRMWLRRQTTKFNGVPYIVQRGAAAVFTEEGMRQAKETIGYYKQNAKIMAETLTRKGIRFFGGVHSPYLWMECPNGMKSWEFFDYLLENAAVVGTPGEGFGVNGEGYFRLTAFGGRDNTAEAMERFQKLF